ncbi:GntR family transcriptional regulator [Streptomyces sp. NPDC054864]
MPDETHRLPQGLLSDDALPLYVRIASRLLDDIAAGGAQAGDRLPSERALSARYEVARVTMRAALKELATRGMIESAPARGWFLTGAGALDPSATGSPAAPAGRTIQGFADYAAKHGLATRTAVLASGVRPATVQEAEELRVGPGSPLFEMRRLRFLDGLVVVVEHNRLPLALCPQLAGTDFTTASLYATLRSATPPQLPRVADYSVEARQPDDEERRLLEISDNTPVLVATQLAFNMEPRPLELTIAIYRGDRYRFRASITD